MEARGGLGGLAGRTVVGPDWTLALIRFSISSMSDWEEGWRATVSRSECDIVWSPEFGSDQREGRSSDRAIWVWSQEGRGIWEMGIFRKRSRSATDKRKVMKSTNPREG